MTEEIKKLADEIRRHNRLYTEGNPEITDKEYDELVEKMKLLDISNPVLLEVGAKLSYGKKVQYQIPMGSLNKVTFQYEKDGSFKDGDGLSELRRWYAENKGHEIRWNMKIDGIAGQLVYENGNLVQASNRGNGLEGFDLTDNARALSSVPHRILTEWVKFNGEDVNLFESKVTIRGEFYIPRSIFQKLIDTGKLGANGAIVNERNVCSGAMNCINPLECEAKGVHFLPYRLYVDDIECRSMKEAEAIVNSLEVSNGKFEFNLSHGEILDAGLISRIDAERAGYDYRTDGIVIYIDDTAERESKGYTGLNPNGMVAFKFETEKKETVLRDIEWNTSALGIIAPIAKFDTVVLADTMVSAASLFNYQMIVDRGIEIGDTVLVEKGGDIIPNIVRVVSHSGSGNINRPDVCPVCGHPVVQEGVHLMCVNPDCFAKRIGRIMAWLNVLEIEKPYQCTVQSLLEQGIISGTDDLYRITVDDFAKASRTSRAQAEVYYKNVHSVKDVELAKFLCTLCINGLGMAYYEPMAEKFKTLDAVLGITEKDLEGLPRFGSIINRKVVEGIKANADYIEKMRKCVNVLDYVKNEGSLDGKSFCFTGKVSRPRKELEELVLKNGGKLSGVGKGLDYLVAGEAAGSKLAKATQLGIKVISEDEFNRLIG